MEIKVKIKKKCGDCKKIRPLAEFKSTNSRCEACSVLPETKKAKENCYKCERQFEPKNKYNKVCTSCKNGDEWSTTFYSVEI